MNLSIAAVINALTDAKEAEWGHLKEEHAKSLIQFWAEYDPKGKGFISPEDLICLLSELPPPLGTNYDRYEKEQLKWDLEPIVIPDLFNLFQLDKEF